MTFILWTIGSLIEGRPLKFATQWEGSWTTSWIPYLLIDNLLIFTLAYFIE